MARETWRENAACIDKPREWWHPVNLQGEVIRETPKQYRRGKAICDECPVKSECLTYALENPDDCCGLWGGLMAIERERLRQDHRREARAARVEFRQREHGVFDIQ